MGGGGPGLSSDLIIGDDASASSAWLPCVVSVGFCQVGEGWGRGEQKNTEIKEHNNTFLIIYYNQRETDPHKTCENNMSGEHNNPESLCFSNYFHLRIFFSTRTSTEKKIKPSISSMDLSLFTRMCFPKVCCALWRMTKPECTISESKINSGKEC